MNILGLQKGLDQAETLRLLEKMGKADQVKTLQNQAIQKISEHFTNMRKVRACRDAR